jgi:hypothetical protein
MSDGPAVVRVNMFLRSISKIDDVRMVSVVSGTARSNQHSRTIPHLRAKPCLIVSTDFTASTPALGPTQWVPEAPPPPREVKRKEREAYHLRPLRHM